MVWRSAQDGAADAAFIVDFGDTPGECPVCLTKLPDYVKPRGKPKDGKPAKPPSRRKPVAVPDATVEELEKLLAGAQKKAERARLKYERWAADVLQLEARLGALTKPAVAPGSNAALTLIRELLLQPEAGIPEVPAEPPRRNRVR